MNNLEDVINDAISDAELPSAPSASDDVTPSDATQQLDSSSTKSGASDEASSEASTEASGSSEVPAPGSTGASKAPVEEDPFEKEHGIPKNGASGRENRIPWSRTKTMVAKGEQRVRDLELKPVQAKLAELEPKVKDYETKLSNVAEFEKRMYTDAEWMFTVLDSIPIYKPFMDRLRAAQPGQPAEQAPTGVSEADPMPQPDQKYEDGSMAYSMEQLTKRDEWQARRIEAKILKELEPRLTPFEQELKAREAGLAAKAHLDKVRPQIEAQLNLARKEWSGFEENEKEIENALRANPAMTLKEGYYEVVFPKLKTNREQMRTEILGELKKAPISTSTPSGGTKAGQEPRAGGTEGAIWAALEGVKGR